MLKHECEECDKDPDHCYCERHFSAVIDAAEERGYKKGKSEMET